MFNAGTEAYECLFITQLSPLLAENRARENAAALNQCQGRCYNLGKIEVRTRTVTTSFSPWQTETATEMPKRALRSAKQGYPGIRTDAGE